VSGWNTCKQGKNREGKPSACSCPLEIADQGLKQKLNREIAAWRDLKHANVAELLGIAYMNNNLPPGLVSRYILRHNFLKYIGRHPE
jgi:hypothetical protein